MISGTKVFCAAERYTDSMGYSRTRPMDTMKDKRQPLIQLLMLFLAGIALEVFCVLLSFLPSIAAKEQLQGLLLYGGSVLSLVILLIGIVGALRGKEVLAKTCFLAQVLLLLAAVIFYVIIRTGFIEVIRDEEEFRTFLERAGVWMSLVFIALQFLQVVILPIPSTVTVVAGSALFGPLLGSIYSLIGILLGSFTAFAVGRFAGYRVVAWLVGKETLDTWLKKIKGKDKIFLSAMFVLPVFPDDVLCFVAGLSSMSFGLFALVIVISRILAIFTTSYSVSLIPFDTWWGLLIWALIAVAVVVVFFLLYKKSDVILERIHKLFHREVRIKEKEEKSSLHVEIISPEGKIVEKGISEGEEPESRQGAALSRNTAPPKEVHTGNKTNR
ncbi:MAG: hypothetical protein DBX60_04500 [Bacillota bacterium]|nr:MAG: hypothetical protein DBX60_04500 [Bacillota bacterium]